MSAGSHFPLSSRIIWLSEQKYFIKIIDMMWTEVIVGLVNGQK